jgi:hypothetical protein
MNYEECRAPIFSNIHKLSCNTNFSFELFFHTLNRYSLLALHLYGDVWGNVAEYNPDAPSMEPRMMWGRQAFRGGPGGIYTLK